MLLLVAALLLQFILIQGTFFSSKQVKTATVSNPRISGGGITWETCNLRTWLNNTFLETSFTTSEKNAIVNTTVINNNNLTYGTAGGNNTVDKVYLLSIEEAMNPSYGFTSATEATKTRESKNTAYMAGKPYMGSSAGFSYWWWLRSPGYSSSQAAFVDRSGNIHCNGDYIFYENNAVRPALYINLLSSNQWTYAGVVSSEGGEEVVKTPNPTTTPNTKSIQGSDKEATALPLPKKNMVKTIGGLKYQVTKSVKKNGTVSVRGVKSKKAKKLTIPKIVKINGYTFNVTAISAKAFSSCKKLKNLTIKVTALKSVGKNALKGIHKKCIIRVSKEQLTSYKKIFKGKGQNKTVKIVRY